MPVPVLEGGIIDLIINMSDMIVAREALALQDALLTGSMPFDRRSPCGTIDRINPYALQVTYCRREKNTARMVQYSTA
jgi:hypothetical protein